MNSLLAVLFEQSSNDNDAVGESGVVGLVANCDWSSSALRFFQILQTPRRNLKTGSTWGLSQARHSWQAKGSMLNTILSKPQASNGLRQQRTSPPALNMSRKNSSKSAKKQKYPNSLKHLALVPQLISILRGSAGRLRPCQNFCQKGWSITRHLCGSTITMSTDGNKLSWERKYILLVTIGYIYRH